MANVGRNIKIFRTRRNMTQDELAGKLFVSRQTVSNYENNKSHPDIDTLVKIAEILDTDMHTLIYGEEDKKVYKSRIIKLIIIIGITIGIGYLSFELLERASEFARDTFLISPVFIVENIVVSSFYILCGWTGMEITCLIFHVHPLKSKYVQWMHITGMIILVGYMIIILPVCILEGARLVKQIKFINAHIEGQIPQPYQLLDIWQQVETRIFFWRAKYPIWPFGILGIILRATKQRKEK